MCLGLSVCYLISVILIVVSVVDCFNVDVEHFTRHRGAPNSMFGFSVALHRYNGASWVIVGAPEAETHQPGVSRGGAVYRCSVVSADSCQELPFDRTGNNNNSVGYQQIDLKSNQWFGATVNSAGVDGPIVACAPRYVWFSTSLTRRDPVGTCYVATGDFSRYSEYAPCRTRQWGYHRQGSCQAGLGAAMAKDGRRVFIGAPGSWYWQGQVYSVKATVGLPFIPPRYKTYGEGQLYSQSLDTRPNVFQTAEGPAMDDDSYLGYSVAVGEFGGYGEEGVAVGMPRGANLLGKVILYTWELTNLQNITGQQLGAYFGYALAVADVDGDDYDDLIVGAPMYTDWGNNEGKFETGRVYIYYQRSDEGMFQKFHIIDGENSRARFGLSLTSLGDINLDNYDDFAVGAPYDGEYGQGAVYIYHGSAKGVREKPSQVIFAEALSDPTLSTFGFSVSGGIDLDNNEYPDLVVGAYESNKAFLFRSRPVAKMDATVTFSAKNRQISLDERNCTLKRHNEAVPCTAVSMCMEFKGVGVRNTLVLNVQYVLDSKKLKNPRMFFLPNENNIINETVSLEHSKRLCKTMYVFIKNGVRDKLTPLEAEMRYSLLYDKRDPYVQFDRELLPVLDNSDGLVAKDSISIQKNCGPDNICIPDLRLIASPSVNKFLLGSNEKLKIEVEVQNEGEDAFEAMFNMLMPAGANFTKIERLDSSKTEIPITCSAPSVGNNHTLKCDIGNPLPRDKLVHFYVIVELETKPHYDFYINVNSTNAENNDSISDNSKHLSVGILVETDVTIDGTSKNQEILFNSTQYTSSNITEEGQLGPQITHIYTIRNNGPSNIEEAEVYFVWPMKTLDGDPLLYLLDEPETAGPIECDYSSFINEYNLKLEGRNSYLDANGITTGSLVSSFSKQYNRYDETYGYGYRKVTGIPEGTQKVLSPEERQKLDEDEFKEESGDASLRHIERTKEVTEQRHHQQGGSFSQQGGTYEHQGGSWGQQSFGQQSGTDGQQGGSYGQQGGSYGQQSGTYGRQGNIYGQQGSSYGQQGGSSQQQGGIYGQQGAGSTEGGVVRVGGSTTQQGGFTQEGSQGVSWQGNQQVGHFNQQGTVVHKEQSFNQQGGLNVQGGSGTKTHQVGTEVRYGPDGKEIITKHVYESRSNSSQVNGGPVQTTTWTQNSSWITGPDGVTRYVGSDDNRRNFGVGSPNIRNSIYYSSSRTGKANSGLSGEPSGIAPTGNSRTWAQGSRQGGSWSSGSGGSQPVGPSTNSESTWSGLSKDGSIRWSGSSSSSHQESVGEWSTKSTVAQTGSHWTGSGSDTQWHVESGKDKNWEQRNKESGSQWNAAQGGSVHVEQGGYQSRDFEAANRRQNATGHFVWTPTGNRGTARDGRQYQGRIWTEERVNSGLGPAIGSGIYSSEGETSSEVTQTRSRNRSTYGKYPHREYDPSLGLGNAALGGGARTTSLDLGILGNVQNSGRSSQGSQYSGSQGGSVQYGTSYSSGDRKNYQTGYDPDLGYARTTSEQYNQVRSRPSSRSSGRKREGANFYSGSEAFATSPEAKSSYSKEYSRQYTYNNPRSRSKREEGQMTSDDYLEQALHCKATQCAVLRCLVGPLIFEDNKKEAWVVFRGRANATTIRKIGGNNPVTVSTMMVARVSKLPYIGRPEDQPVKSHEVFTTIVSKDVDSKPDVVPLWVVVLSAVAGTLILLLLIYLLYVMGFFERNRPNDAPERQPLNKNGHYQNGDEQL